MPLVAVSMAPAPSKPLGVDKPLNACTNPHPEGVRSAGHVVNTPRAGSCRRGCAGLGDGWLRFKHQSTCQPPAWLEGLVKDRSCPGTWGWLGLGSWL